MIVQPRGPLLGPFRVILAHDNVSQSQAIRFEYRHDPTEGDQRPDLRVSVEIRGNRIREAWHHIDLRILCVWRECFYDAPVKVGEIAVARHVDAHGTGSLDLERSICTFRHQRAILPFLMIILRQAIIRPPIVDTIRASR